MDKFCEQFLINQQLINYKDLKYMFNYDNLDINKWKFYTKYENCDLYTNEIIWFWQYVDDNDLHTNKLLLKFVTGSELLPIGGFKYLYNDKIPFTIKFNNFNGSLPTSQTCINMLNLYKCKDQEEFIKNMDIVITDCTNFDFI